ILFDSDFADLFEVRGLRRQRRGRLSRSLHGAATAKLTYDGLDGVRRQTALTFDPPPTELGKTAAAYQVRLAPKQVQALTFSVACGEPDALAPGSSVPDSSAPGASAPDSSAPAPFMRGLLAAHRELRRAAQNACTVASSNDIFNEIVCRSMADLYMLMTHTPQGPYPYAGIPWYSTTFGRDGLITAMQMLWIDPRVARGVLRRLAAYQAKTYDAESDAQPGKILHEMRGGEMAALREVPFRLYYGSVDATPLFVLLAGLYYERTDDLETIRALWPAIEAALAWVDGDGDPDGDGFVEYQRATAEGLANQGWKDSHDAIFHADGRLAEGPIALAEVQGYVYAAKRLAARCAERLGLTEQAFRLRAESDALAERFEESFWCPQIGSYALALDGAKRQCRV